MTPNKETPAGKAGASRESLVGTTRENLTLTAYRAQRFAYRYALPIETAALLAALAFGGGYA
jgi:hypothetical protein